MTDHCGPGRRKAPASRRSDPEEMLAKVQAAAEEMTMRRYVHTPPEGRPCCPEGCLAALLGELNQIQDHRNQILVELLRTLERMAAALDGR
ncbi:MAG: hypothetical protein KH338_07010 [Oscillospiraceae bacterium]|nr:hypothetical protein [Oscillospiraceae bacterium]